MALGNAETIGSRHYTRWRPEPLPARRSLPNPSSTLILVATANYSSLVCFLQIHQEHMSLDELALEAENNPHIKLSKRKLRVINENQARYQNMKSCHPGNHLSLSAEAGEVSEGVRCCSFNL